MIKIQSISRSLPTSGKGLVFLAVGLLFLGWLLNTPSGLLGKADAVGYAVCHRIDVRSFHIGDRPLPLCSRCTGMYIGAVLGLIFQFVSSGKRSGLPDWRLWVLFGFIAAAFAVDGINSYMQLFPGAPSLYEPNNLTRLITGSGMGLIIAFVIYPSFNQTVWKRPDMRPALAGIKPFFLSVGLILILDGLIWLENPLLLFGFSLVSALGVLTLLTMIYSVFWLMLMKRDNHAVQFKELVFPLTLGFGTTILQIALFDFARFWMTGTWDGFHLG